MNKIDVGRGKISRVVMYYSGAMVYRECEFTLEAGASEVVFSGLNECYASEYTFCARGEYSVTSSAVTKNDSERCEKLDELKAEKAELERKAAVCVFREDFWRDNAKMENASSSELEKRYEIFGEKIEALTLERSEIMQKIERVQKKIDDIIKQNKADFKSGDTANIVICVSSQRDRVSGTIELASFVERAGWSGEYDCLAYDSEKFLTLSLNAKAYNNSGEDWQDVKMIFSTDCASERLSLPQFSSEYIGGAMPRGYMRSNAAVAVMSAPMTQSDMISARVSQDATARTYEIAAQSLYSGAEAMTCLLETVKVAQEIKYYAYPLEDSAVYLAAMLSENIIGITAPSRVYYNNELVCRGEITPDTKMLALGKASQVYCEREEGNSYTQDKFLSEKVTCDFTITISSQRSDKITLYLVDRLPVSSNKSVTVEPLSLGGAKLDEASGKLEWQLELAAASAKTLQIKYQIINKK